MEDQQTEKWHLDAEHRGLTDQLINEHDLCIVLGIGGRTIDDMRRNKGLPFCRLTTRARVYLVADVLDWLRKQKAQ